MIPDNTQARIIQSGDGSPRAMLAETMKMPDPIIEPATSIVASVRVIALTNPVPACGVASVVTAELLIQVRKKREGVDGGCRRRFRHNPAKSRGALGLPLGMHARIGLVRERRHATSELVSDLCFHAKWTAVGASSRLETHLSEDLG